MENITSLITAMSDELKQSDPVKRHAFAKESYETDETLTSQMAELTAQRRALAEEYRAEPRNENSVTAINNRINELYTAITNSEAYITLETAHSEMNSFLQSVFDAITALISGGGSGCGSGCGSCGGCGEH